MTQEFVMLSREVAERALKSMMDARCSVYDGFEYDKAATAFAAALEQAPALDQPQANQPAMTPIAQRKLDSLLAEGYTISGYSVYHEQKHQHGFVTGAGLVGWWKPEGVEYPQPQCEQEPVAWISPSALEWSTRESEKVVKLTRKAQPEYDFTEPLYTHPQPAQKPLTDEEILKAVRHLYHSDLPVGMGFSDDLDVARAIERAHGIGDEV